MGRSQRSPVLLCLPGTRLTADPARLQVSSADFPISLIINNFYSTLITLFFFPLFWLQHEVPRAVLPRRTNGMYCL